MEWQNTELKKMFEILEENEKTIERFHRVEAKILSILNFKDFLEKLLQEIENNFNIPYVWITMIKNTEVCNFIQSLDDSELLAQRTNIIDEHDFYQVVCNDTKPIVTNQNIASFHNFLPNIEHDAIGSLAISPITIDGKIIGSFNQGDQSSKRFTANLNINLLQQLAVKVSLCLSNVTAHEKLKFLAYHDPLTGLLNRRVMEQVLLRELNRAKRYKSDLSIVFIDLNAFKAVNDTCGHDHGDKLLIHIAESMLHICRDLDIVSRFAGDEFVLILPETTIKKANLLMKRIQNYLSKNPLKVNNLTTYGSISYGIAYTNGTDKSLSSTSMIKDADKKLYENKKKLYSLKK